MRTPIDVTRSIITDRLCTTDNDLNQVVNSVLYGLMAGAFFFVGFVFPALLLWQSGFSSLNTFTITLLLIFFFIGCMTLLGVIDNERLTRIQGKDLESNKKVLVGVLKEIYKTDLIYEGENMISYYRRATFWRFAIRVIVLFDRNDALINISRFNQLGIKSFWHYFSIRAQKKLVINGFSYKRNQPTGGLL